MSRLVIIIFTLLLNCAALWATPASFEEKTVQKYGQDKLHTFEHKETGMEVIWIENKDRNASFMLGVKTPTHNSTGVNHIIEHTVFTGSQNYPSATMFFDASNTYPHTFMNAMTSADRTLYPFSTPYKESFEKLLSIYLDSVFNPAMLKQKNSFYEEAFHYNPITKNYGGVVYNEMKGANDSINRDLFRSIRQTHYKGTHYANDSGGEVDSIPKLTYEEFVMTYKAYYRPGNMMVVLYGDIEMENVLKSIDEIINKYPRVEHKVEVCVEPQKAQEEVVYTNSTLKNTAYIIKSFLIHEELSPEEEIEMDAWINAYLVDERSYFMSRLRQLGIPKVQIEKDSDTKYPIYSIILPQVPLVYKEQVQKNLETVLAEMAYTEKRDTPTEQDVLERNKLSTYTIDTLTNRGINISESILEAWTHQKSLDQYFKMKEHIKQLKEVPLVCRDKLFKTDYKATIVIEPKEQDISLSSPLDLSSIPEKDWQGITEAMLRWQEEQKSKALQNIPLKKLLIKPKLKCEVKENGLKYILAYTDTELLNTEVYLPTASIEQEALPYLFLYTYMLNEAAREITPFQGICQAQNTVIYDEKGYIPYLNISLLTSSKEGTSYEMMNKARKTLLEKDIRWYVRKLNQYVRGFKEKNKEDILDTLSILNKGAMTGGKRYEYEMQFPLYKMSEKLLKEKDMKWIERVKQIDSSIEENNAMYVGITGNKEQVKKTYSKWCETYNKPTKETQKYGNYKWNKLSKDSLYSCKSEVDYLVYSHDMQKAPITGIDYVTASFVTKNYLQPRIRIQKGAYGSGMNAVFPNSLSFYTYRDPDYKSSIVEIEAMPKDLEKLMNVNTLESAKANALSKFQNQVALLENDLLQVEVLQRLILMGESPILLTELQEQMIETKLCDLKEACSGLKEVLRESAVGLCTSKEVSTEGKRVYKTTE